MKKVSIISLIALVAIVISSCGSSNNVVSNHGISKRKYTKGYFFQRNSNLKSDDAKAKDTELKEGTAIAKAEKAEARKANKALKVDKRNENLNVASTETSNLIQVEENRAEQYVNSEVQERTGTGTDGVNWSVTENNPSATEESFETMPYENRNQPAKKEKNNGRGGSGDAIFILAVIFAILLPPLGVAIYTNIDWIKVLIALLLMLLFFLPGMIYALLVVFDVI